MSSFELDLRPLYRSTVGFDQLAPMMRRAWKTNSSTSNYPPYNIEVEKENRYQINLALAGYAREDLDIQVEEGTLIVRGKKSDERKERKYLYQGIAGRSFERKFNLAEHVEVKSANFTNGLLTIKLTREIPEALKPKRISINQTDNVIKHHSKSAA